MKISVNNKSVFQCEECGFKFYDEENAKKCEGYCRDQGICNSEIALLAIKEEE